MFDWVQMLTATLQPNQAETRFLPPQNCISLWKSASYIFLLLHIFDIFKRIMYCIEDYITVSPARSVFHPRIKLHQNENLWNTKLHYYWQATNQTVASPITVPIEKTNHKIILGLWGEDWSHWEGLWSHISCPVRLVPHCCLGTCKENIQITVEHIFKLLRFFLIPNYLNIF